MLPLTSGQTILMMGTEEPYTGGGSGHVKGYEHVDYATAFKNKYGQNFQCKKDPSDHAIRNADVVIYRLNKETTEGRDIPYEAPVDQHEELMRCAPLNPNFIVVITSGNGMPMPWLDDVKSVLWTNFLGQERGHAMLNVLSGAVNPSGHLPFTIEKKFADSPDPDYNIFGNEPYWEGKNEFKDYFLGNAPDSKTTMARYIQPHQLVHIRYREGIFVGYRWYDHKNIEPQFPFGHGLSYSTFNFSSLALDAKSLSQKKDVNISFNIKNTGSYDGAQVVQLYIHKPNSKIKRPAKELKKFKKIFLKLGAQQKVTLSIGRNDFKYWDTEKNNWAVEPGTYELLVGSSSRNIHLKTKINIG